MNASHAASLGVPEFPVSSVILALPPTLVPLPAPPVEPNPINPEINPEHVANLLAAAQAAIDCGWYIFPMERYTKNPFACTLNAAGLPLKFYNGMNSFYSASNSDDYPLAINTKTKMGKHVRTKATQSWRDGLDTNVGIALEKSNLTVLDFDSGFADEAAFYAFLKIHGIPLSWIVQSGRITSFGAHIYYQGVMTSGEFEIDGINCEVKSIGEVVAGAGSYHKSGQQYKWITDLSLPLTPTPVTLFTQLINESKTKLPPPHVVDADAIHEAPGTIDDEDKVNSERLESWWEKCDEEFTYYGRETSDLQREMWIREDGCPCKEFHTNPDGVKDFAVFLDDDGKLYVNCCHKSCEMSWGKYRLWVDEQVGHRIPMIPVMEAIIGGKKLSPEASPEASPETSVTIPPVPPPPAPPVHGMFDDLPESSLYGILGDICTEQLPIFPRIWALLTLLTSASVLVPPSPETGLVVNKIRPNLYTALIGPTHAGKSSVITFAMAILGLTEGHPNIFEETFGSAEGLMRTLSNSDKVPGSSQLVLIDELLTFFLKMGIEGSILPSFFNTLFYKNRYSATVAKGVHYDIDFQMSLLGGIPGDQLEKALNASTAGGVFDRLLLAPQPDGCKKINFHLLNEITAVNLNPVPVTIHPDVKQRLAAWVDANPDAGRVSEQILKIAIIFESMMGISTLHANSKALDAAVVIGEHQLKIREVLKPCTGENAVAECLFKIMKHLKHNGGTLTKRQLSRAIHADRFGPNIFDSALRACELEVGKKDKSPAIWVRLVGEDEL